MWGKLEGLTKSNKLNELKPEKLLFTVFNKNKRLLDIIVDLNTMSQLYERGIDGKGQSLDAIGGSYKPYTIRVKQAKGQRTDHVTLNDTSEFYESFTAVAKKDGVVITADTIKKNDDLMERWGDDIIGLDEESMGELVGFLAPYYSEYLKRALLS